MMILITIILMYNELKVFQYIKNYVIEMKFRLEPLLTHWN